MVQRVTVARSDRTTAKLAGSDQVAQENRTLCPMDPCAVASRYGFSVAACIKTTLSCSINLLWGSVGLPGSRSLSPRA
jgi:hypothetical protein